MTIDFNMNEKNLGVALDGRLDTITAPELESFLAERYNAITSLTIRKRAFRNLSSRMR